MEELLLSLGPFVAAAGIGWLWIKQMSARLTRLEKKLDECRQDHKKAMEAHIAFRDEMLRRLEA